MPATESPEPGSPPVPGAPETEHAPPASPVAIEETAGYLELTVGGVVQSVEPGSWRSERGYWAAMLPERRPESALILGLGGGTLAMLLHRRFAPGRIVGVDHDPLMPELGRLRFGLDADAVEIVEADALDYVAKSDERFDYIAVDLYTAAEFDPRALRRPFLRRLADHLTDEGEAVFNLWRDRRLKRRVDRLGRTLTVVRQTSIDSNLIVFCRRPVETG